MLRPLENSLSFPEFTPDVDLSPLDCLKPYPGEFFAILDPPREKMRGFLLHTRGDGWSDPHTEQCEAAEVDYKQKEAEALERIKIHESDPRSHKAYTLAKMAAEVAMAAHEHWQKMLTPQDPGAAMELRPDSYTVARPGDGVPFAPGDRVMIAPYAARRFQSLFDVPDVVLVGREDPWEDIVPMVWSPLSQTWEMTSNWVAVRFDRKTVAVSKGLEIQTTKRRFLNTGKVLAAGPQSEFTEGEHVVTHRDRTVLRPDDTKWFSVKHHPWSGEGVMVVRETDSDGVRRILGSLEMPTI